MARKKIIKKAKTKDISGIAVFVISLLVILISGLVSYFYLKQNDETLEQIKQMKEEGKIKEAERDKVEGELMMISRLTGWRVEAPWRSVPKGGWTDDQSLKKALNQWVLFLKEKYGINKYEPWPVSEEEIPIQSEKTLNVRKLIAELEQIGTTNYNNATACDAPRDTARQKEREVVGTVIAKNPSQVDRIKKDDSALINLLDEKNSRITAQRKEIFTSEERIGRLIVDQEVTKKDLAKKLRELSAEIINITQTNTATIIELEQKLVEYQDSLEKLKKRVQIAKEGIEIDGEVIVADPVNGYVYISLGKDEAIFSGMEFDVFDIQKGGIKVDKGRIKIIKLYDRYSEAAITDTTDPQNPIAVNDLVDCKVYHREKAKVFAFAGQLIGKYNTAELTKRIENFGGSVSAEISPDITYLVLGEITPVHSDLVDTDERKVKEYEKNPEYQKYQKASQIGTVVIREKELYGMLSIKWE